MNQYVKVSVDFQITHFHFFFFQKNVIHKFLHSSRHIFLCCKNTNLSFLIFSFSKFVLFKFPFTFYYTHFPHNFPLFLNNTKFPRTFCQSQKFVLFKKQQPKNPNTNSPNFPQKCRKNNPDFSPQIPLPISISPHILSTTFILFTAFGLHSFVEKFTKLYVI